MRNSPTPVPPTVTRIVFLRNTKSSRRLARGGKLAVREEEAIVVPVRLSLQESPSDPQISTVVSIPPPYRAKDPVRRLPIGRGRHRQRVESVRHDEVQGRRTGEEEEIQIPPSIEQTAGERNRSRRVPETLRVDREVAAEFLHRATHCPLPERPSDETAASDSTTESVNERERGTGVII